MDSSFSPKDEIWFLRVYNHISNAVCEMKQTVFEPMFSVLERLNTRAPDNTTTRLTLPGHLEQNVSSDIFTSSVLY